MVSTDEVKEIQAYLDQYDWFHVREEKNGKLIREFYASGVEIRRGNYIVFKRLFANRIYVSQAFNYVKKGTNTKENVEILFDKTVYSIKLLHKKVTNLEKCKLIGNFMLDDLLSPCFLSKHIIKGNTYYLLDLEKMGELNLKQYNRISLLIDFYIDGRNVNNQCCRIPGFSIEKHNGNTFVYAHVYNIETLKCLNKINIYEELAESF